jgi:hypothetical protein
MRFISPYPGLRLIVKHQEVELLANGSHRVTAPGFTAEFRTNDVTSWEADAARANFTFKGQVTEEGSERPIDPVPSRVGTYDTSVIQDAKLRKTIEDKMLAHPDHGRDFLMVAKPVVAAPWPKYDTLKNAKTIAEKVDELGLDAETVIAYESGNQNREAVIAALKALTAVEEEELVAA